MPKAKNRNRDRRGERFPRGKRRLDPWVPLPPIGTILVTTQQLNAWWGSIGPRTLVRIARHTREEPGNYGPGLMVLPVDPNHPLYRCWAKFPGWDPSGDVALYVANGEVRTHVRLP